MGKVMSACSQPPRPQQRTVTYLANSIPDDKKYKAINPDSIRLFDVTAFKRQRNFYQFTMALRNQGSDIKQIVPVLNQMVYCLGSQNYKLDIETQMIVDIFDKRLESTMISAKNPRTAREYSIRVIPFKSYTSSKFKNCLHQIYLNKIFGLKSYTTVKLMDYFVYGINPDQQAFVLLFDKCSTSLANVAQYRKQANTPWLLKQKIKVISQIFNSYQSLYNRRIIHRDLRPSNVFYVPSVGKFLIGNFSRARKMQKQLNDDLKSVCGVPDFCCQQMQHLMLQGEKIGYYDGIRQDYTGLKSILNIIQTCQFYNKNPKIQNQQISKIKDMLTNNIDFNQIIHYISQIATKNSVNLTSEMGDRQIANSCSFLLAHTHKAVIEKYMFQTYGYLGYYQNYSEKAHRMIDQNNQNGKQTQNAYILAKMGDFYEENGAGGFQYYYNAFVLFILRADNQIRYGNPHLAQAELQEAQSIYFKFNRSIQSDVPRIQVKRVQSLIELANGKPQQARNIINQNLVAASKSNIPIQKQCKILLTYGKIYGQQSKIPQIMPMMDEALKKLATGLNICENSAVFDSPSQCRIMKSRFLRQMGTLYSKKIRVRIYMDKDKQIPNQLQIKAQAETYLRSALQIQQREPVDDLEVADTAEELATFYYFDRNFAGAKKYYEVARVRLSHMKQHINPNRQLMVLYSLGSSNYYMREYQEAKMNYITCLASLERFPKTQANQILYYNIEGNLGLVLIKLQIQGGRQKVQSALLKIKQIKGENSFDYASLYNNYLVVNNP